MNWQHSEQTFRTSQMCLMSPDVTAWQTSRKRMPLCIIKILFTSGQSPQKPDDKSSGASPLSFKDGLSVLDSYSSKPVWLNLCEPLSNKFWIGLYSGLHWGCTLLASVSLGIIDKFCACNFVCLSWFSLVCEGCNQLDPSGTWYETSVLSRSPDFASSYVCKVEYLCQDPFLTRLASLLMTLKRWKERWGWFREKVGRLEGWKVLGVLMMLNRAQGRISL